MQVLLKEKTKTHTQKNIQAKNSEMLIMINVNYDV